MADGKYIIKKIKRFRIETEVAILFHPTINHCDIGTRGESRGEAVAAGFFRTQRRTNPVPEMPFELTAYGQSDSLKGLKSRGDVDAVLILEVMGAQF